MATHAERQSSRFINGRRGWNPNRQLEAYLFLLPSLLGFLAFIVAPVIGSLGLSLVRWNLLTAPEFVGLNNYVEIFTRDPVQTLWESMDAIRLFAGDQVETAVVAPAAQPMFRSYDHTVMHYEVVLTAAGAQL